MNRIRILILIGLFSSLLMYPFFFRLDFGRSDYDTLDLILMTSPFAWVLLTISCLLLGFDVILTKKFGLLHLSILTLLVYGLFIASQYPTPLQVDFFIHSAGAREIAEYGTIDVNYGYPQSWPGAFILWANLSLITSMDVIGLNWFLIFLCMGIETLLLFLIGKKILGSQWAGLPGALYLTSNAFAFVGLQRDRFSPSGFGFLLYLLLLYFMLLKVDVKRSAKLALVSFFLISVIAISHAFSTFTFLLILLGIFVVKKSAKNHGISFTNFLLFVLILTITWWMINSPSTFQRALLLPFSTTMETSKISGIVTSSGSTTDLGRILRDYYFRPLLLIVGITTMVGLFQIRKSKTSRLHYGIILGLSGSALIGLIVPISQTEIQWGVILPLLLVPVTPIASFVASKNNRRAKAASLLIVLLTVPSFLTMFSYQSLYFSSVQSWEIEGLQFFATHNRIPTRIECDKFTIRLYGVYFDKNHLAEIKEVLLTIVNYTERIEEYPTFFSGDTIIRTFKQELYTNNFISTRKETHIFWDQVDANTNNYIKYDKLYDSHYVSIYRQGS